MERFLALADELSELIKDHHSGYSLRLPDMYLIVDAARWIKDHHPHREWEQETEGQQG